MNMQIIEVNGMRIPRITKSIWPGWKTKGHIIYSIPLHINAVYKAITKKDNVDNLEVIRFYYEWAKELNDNGYSVTPYQIDKMIWLISTGEFYLDKDETTDRETIINKINEMTKVW